jgi:hypothetical protein
MAHIKPQENLMRIVIDYQEITDLLHALAAIKSAVMNGKKELGVKEIGYKVQYSIDRKEMPYFIEREVVLDAPYIREVKSRVEIDGDKVIHYYPSALNSVSETH